ncbi:MAG: cation diffusion facilitator family transporter [Pseudomonadota bacterium]
MSAADHNHDHSDHSHHHALPDTADGRRRTAIAALLTFCFMIAEVIGGLVSGSLALLADAAHMLTDAGSLGLAWLGFRLAEHPADDRRSFGWARFKVLAAFVNGLALIVLAIWIAFEAIGRLMAPQPVMGDLLLGVAIIGLVVNCFVFWVLHGGDQADLNMQGALWHVAGDLLGSVAAIAAAIVILMTGWMPIDPLLSLVVAIIITLGGYRLVRKTGHILIEGVPEGLSATAIKQDLERHVQGAEHVDHIHAWALNESKALVTVDVTASAGASPEVIRRSVKARLKTRFGVEHATVEVISTDTG